MKRFWDKVNKTKDCWLWQAYLRPTGYGTFQVGTLKNPKIVYAHRFAYELLVGKIPNGLVLDHLCKNRSCVNPSHLEPVTVKENVLRSNNFTAFQAKQTHCIHGHEFNKTNTYYHKGHRSCKICRANRVRAFNPLLK